MLRFSYCVVVISPLYWIEKPLRQKAHGKDSTMNTPREIEIVRHTTMNNMEIFLVEMIERCPHGHDDLEIGLLLEGSLTLYLEQETYRLSKGDIYLINRYQVHSFLNAGEKNLTLAFQIPTDFYRRLNKQLTYLRFDSNVIHSGHLHNQLSGQLLACAELYFGDKKFRELECSSLLLHALHLLLENCPYTVTGEREYHTAQNDVLRINRITEFITEHHQDPILLEDIAKQEHITVCHASHFIRKMLGISFQEYLNNTRFDHALRLLSQTDLSLLDICMESGFSSSRYLNRMFEKNFGCNAREYRKTYPKNKIPAIKEQALPVSNVQKRYSFERSAFLLQSYFSLKNFRSAADNHYTGTGNRTFRQEHRI